jgi:hypothetical protein
MHDGFVRQSMAFGWSRKTSKHHASYAVVWGALFLACRMHGNISVEKGYMVISLLVKMQQWNW